MAALVDAIAGLVALPASGPALIVQTPQGEYEVSADGTGGGPQNRYVISRRQLRVLMWAHGVSREDLARPQIAAVVAGLVANYDPATSHATGQLLNTPAGAAMLGEVSEHTELVEPREVLGYALYRGRERAGMGLSDAAEVADVSELDLFDVEHGTTAISPEAVVALADAYRIDADEVGHLLTLASALARATAVATFGAPSRPGSAAREVMTLSDPAEDTTEIEELDGDD